MKEENFSFLLLTWFQENARKLPWRETKDPYHIWLSEIMLQQTRVVAVIGYYQRFLEELPTISALAKCEEDVLLKLWQGLGYYNRARNLQKAAIEIMTNHGGVFPQAYEDIRKLSGIGDYTAGAIASTAFALPYPAVDGNVFRVFSRIKGDNTDISTPEMKKRVSAWVREEMPPSFSGDFNQSLMELGAVVCIPNGEPLCKTCPVSKDCACYGSEKWRELPVKPSKKPRKEEFLKVYLVEWQGKIALRKRPEKGLLAKMWEYPHYAGEIPDFFHKAEEFGRGKHLFTHITWHMTGYSLKVEDISPFPQEWHWVTAQEMAEKYPLPSAFAWVKEKNL
ncbi:MAG: A/G-specific adenine glycosylase [Eubacteriales bacterium]